MRNLFVMAILLFGVSCMGQFNRYKATNYASDIDGKGWCEWQAPTGTLIVCFDIDEGLITINNKFEDSFILTGTPEFIEDLTDSDGDDYSQMRSYAIDQTGVECTIKIKTWDDYNLLHFYIYYSSLSYVYEVKEIY